MRSVRTLVLTVGLLVALAPTASAAVSASLSGGVLTVTGDNVNNNVTVVINGANYEVQGATVAGSGCAGAGPVTCPIAGTGSINAVLLDDNDVWDSDGINIPTTVDLGNGFFFNFQSARTGNGADTILGGPSVESDIVTGGGNDTIRLFGGNDAQIGFTFTGGIGSLLAGPGDDTIDLGDGADGGAGTNFIDGGPGNDTYDLGAGNDRNVIEPVVPGGNDTILAGPGDDGINFGLDGGDGNDTVDGGPGDDTGLFGSLDTDSVTGGPDNDTLGGESGDNVSETVQGGPGDDLLLLPDNGPGLADANGDTVSGGAGRDSVTAGPTQSSVSFTADGVPDDGFNYAPKTANILGDVEILIGGGQADSLGGGGGGTFDLRGLDGDDTLTGAAGPTRMDGGDGADTLNGSSADDVLLGANGNDTLNGNDGDDMMTGGTGADGINGGGGSDTGDWSTATSPVTLTPGDAVPDGEIAEEDLLGGDVENLVGGPFSDTVTGAPGPSLLSTGAGDDTVTANDGAADNVLCGTGNDNVNGDPEDHIETVGAERCETVTQAAALLALGANKKADKKGRVKLNIGCPADEADGCFGDAGLIDKKGETLSKAVPFGVAAGQTQTVQVKLDKDALKTLEKKNKLKAVILAELDAGNGLIQKLLQNVKLKD